MADILIQFKKYCGADVVELKTAISILMTGALIGMKEFKLFGRYKIV